MKTTDKFTKLKEKLNILNNKFKEDKEKIDSKLEKKRSEYFTKKDNLIEKISEVCPHKNETYEDTWHPHTRDGDQYYECDLCGNKRYV